MEGGRQTVRSVPGAQGCPNHTIFFNFCPVTSRALCRQLSQGHLLVPRGLVPAVRGALPGDWHQRPRQLPDHRMLRRCVSRPSFICTAPCNLKPIDQAVVWLRGCTVPVAWLWCSVPVDQAGLLRRLYVWHGLFPIQIRWFTLIQLHVWFKINFCRQ